MANQANGHMTQEQAEALMRLINELGLCTDVHCVEVVGWSERGNLMALRSYELPSGDFVRGHWDGLGIFYVERFRVGEVGWKEESDDERG